MCKSLRVVRSNTEPKQRNVLTAARFRPGGVGLLGREKNQVSHFQLDRSNFPFCCRGSPFQLTLNSF